MSATMLKQDSKTGLWYNVIIDEETGEVLHDPMAVEAVVADVKEETKPAFSRRRRKVK